MTKNIIYKSRLYYNKKEIIPLKQIFDLQGADTEIVEHIIDNTRCYQLYLKEEEKSKDENSKVE